MNEPHIVTNPELNIWEALLPVIVLVILLSFNVYVFGDNALSGSNQFILLMGAAAAAIVGFRNKVSYKQMMEEIGENYQSAASAILILLMVGALAGSWLVSGIIPAMVYYGLKILHPSIFLPSCVVITSVISLATGSSWTTSATVGIALIGIGKILGIPVSMVAGAVISGAYFGDKMSPLSDTTNLAPAIAGSELFDHIRYMTLTTIPTIIFTILAFVVINLFQEVGSGPESLEMLSSIEATFNINPFLFLVPILVIVLVVKKTNPVTALLIGTLAAALFAVIFQPDILMQVAESDSLSFVSAYKGTIIAMTEGASIATDNESINDLFSSGGMAGMMSTIWLIICALTFGGVMDAIGALNRISKSLLNLAKTTFGLFASTVASCLAINITASDQYLAIVVPGKMFAKAYTDRGLDSVNLSRTLEDSGTVTSVLVPWNTCAAYQSGVLGVSVYDYFIYAFFNYLSPFTTLLYAALDIKIKRLIRG